MVVHDLPECIPSTLVQRSQGRDPVDFIAMVSMRIAALGVKARRWRVNATSDCASIGYLYFARIPRLMLG